MLKNTVVVFRAKAILYLRIMMLAGGIIVYNDILNLKAHSYHYASLAKFESKQRLNLAQLPFSLKILLENLLRHFDQKTVTKTQLDAFSDWLKTRRSQQEISYQPARVLMQDFTGVPAVVDLAAMRDAIEALGGTAEKINPMTPVDLVIDHSVQVDAFANKTAFKSNVDLEMSRNHERYQFLRWGQAAFDNFSVIPPGTGICHQVNLEYIAQCIWQNEINGNTWLYPDTLVGTDSHTTMVNGMGILGWGVGGIEAEAAMLGQPISMFLPEVIGFKLTGQLSEGVTATDLVLQITETLRQKGVVGKFVEFCGPGIDALSLADRATIANMAPEYGATCGFFPIDHKTLAYLHLTARDPEHIARIRSYCSIQGLWRDNRTPDPIFTDIVALDLSDIKPALAGPKRPQDRVELQDLAKISERIISEQSMNPDQSVSLNQNGVRLKHGDVVIAAITSCTNTSNPNVLMAAGLLAKKAIEKGLRQKPWVKTSLAPGSKVVTEYLTQTGLQSYLDQLGFNLVGYGCTTCIGNSGPLDQNISNIIQDHGLVLSSILSGNRNFEGRVHPLVKSNWLASPPLVVAYAIAGTTRINLTTDPIAHDPDGQAVYLKDLWPSNDEIAEVVSKISKKMFETQYQNIFKGDAAWQAIPVSKEATYHFDTNSTYIQKPPFFEGIRTELPVLSDIQDAYILAKFGDSITTDHISPAGMIKSESPAGRYLKSQGIEPKDFNTYGARRGNHQVMMRGTFANIRIKNELLDGTEGGFTRHIPSQTVCTIYEAAMHYQAKKHPLIIIAGREYGTGSSRDWAAKGTRLLGIKAVITESFERIHRSNLIGMGVLPLQFTRQDNRNSLKLTGNERISLLGLNTLRPQSELSCKILYAEGHEKIIPLLCRIDTENELNYYKHDGILHYVLRKLIQNQ